MKGAPPIFVKHSIAPECGRQSVYKPRTGSSGLAEAGILRRHAAMSMRRIVLGLGALLGAIVISLPMPDARAQFCSDDYVTIDNIMGTILEINPAPDPFKSADIFLTGPERCTRMWMLVLKTDAEQCRVGDRIEAKGVVTSDPENDSWQINPESDTYMRLGVDFTCTR